MSEPLFEKPLDEMLPPDEGRKPPPRFNDPTEGPAAMTRELPREHLHAIARGQKWLIRLLLVGVLYGIGIIVLMSLIMPVDEESPGFIALVIALTLVHTALSAVMFVVFVLLAVRLYSTTEAIFLAIATQVCCVGVIVLLMVNARATKVLRANGVKVGLLGARRSHMEQLAPPGRKKAATGNDRLPKLGW